MVKKYTKEEIVKAMEKADKTLADDKKLDANAKIGLLVGNLLFKLQFFKALGDTK